MVNVIVRKYLCKLINKIQLFISNTRISGHYGQCILAPVEGYWEDPTATLPYSSWMFLLDHKGEILTFQSSFLRRLDSVNDTSDSALDYLSLIG